MSIAAALLRPTLPDYATGRRKDLIGGNSGAKYESMSKGSIPARAIACRAARTANCDVYSPGAALRRCLMPVRAVIQSSEVSTIFSRSAFVRIPSG